MRWKGTGPGEMPSLTRGQRCVGETIRTMKSKVTAGEFNAHVKRCAHCQTE
jgi:hypothetical protein